MKFYKFWKNMTIQKKWFLDEPTTANGVMLDGWNFTMGVPYSGDPPVKSEQYQKGVEVPVAFGGLDTPYLRSDIAAKIMSIDPAGIQVFPVTVTGTKNEYWIVNVLRVVDAIHSSSEIEFYSDVEKSQDPELALRYKYVRRLVLDQTKIQNGVHIFRTKYNLNDIFVSEKIKSEIDLICPDHGGNFYEINAVA